MCEGLIREASRRQVPETALRVSITVSGVKAQGPVQLMTTGHCRAENPKLEPAQCIVEETCNHPSSINPSTSQHNEHSTSARPYDLVRLSEAALIWRWASPPAVLLETAPSDPSTASTAVPQHVSV